MADIIAFPSEEVRSWASWCSCIHDAVRCAGHPPTLAEHVLTKIRPLFDVLCEPGSSGRVSVSVCGACVPAIEDLRHRLHQQQEIDDGERNRRILMERIRREFEIYLCGA